MTQQPPVISEKDYIRSIRERLDGAVTVTKAAEACARAGDSANLLGPGRTPTSYSRG
jgi:hypothetical protein